MDQSLILGNAASFLFRGLGSWRCDKRPQGEPKYLLHLVSRLLNVCEPLPFSRMVVSHRRLTAGYVVLSHGIPWEIWRAEWRSGTFLSKHKSSIHKCSTDINQKTWPIRDHSSSRHSL